MSGYNGYEDFVARVVIEPDFSRFGPQLEQGVLDRTQTAERNIKTPGDDYARSLSLASQGKVDAAARAAASGYLKEVEAAIVALQSLGTSTDKAIQTEIQTQLAQLTVIRNEIQLQLSKSRLDNAGGGFGQFLLHGTSGGGGDGPNGPRGLGQLAGGGPALASLGLRFGAIGIGVTAAFQAVGKLTEALKVDGDEATTTAGKLRNAGAAILSADVIGAFQALNVHAETSTEALKRLKAEASTTPVDLRNLGSEAGEAADKLDKLVESGGATGRLGAGLAKAAEEARKVKEESLALADALETAATAAADVDAKIKAAGSDAAAFGEAGRIGAEGNRRPGDRGGTVDSTDTFGTENQTAEANARTDEQLLGVLRREEQQAKERLGNLKKGDEGYAAALLAYAQAKKRTDALEKQIQDRNKAEAEAKAREAEAARKAAEDAAKRRADAAAAAYRDDLGVQEQILQLAASRARLTEKDLTDDRKAGKNLLEFYRREAQDKRLTRSERLRYAELAVQEQLDLKNLGKKDKKPATGVSGFTLGELFQEAVENANTFRSNIAGRGGNLSAQDARGAFGGTVAKNVMEFLATRSLTEQEKQTAVLSSIDRRLAGGGVRGAERVKLQNDRYATVQGLRGAAMAAYWQYGIN